MYKCIIFLLSFCWGQIYCQITFYYGLSTRSYRRRLWKVLPSEFLIVQHFVCTTILSCSRVKISGWCWNVRSKFVFENVWQGNEDCKMLKYISLLQHWIRKTVEDGDGNINKTTTLNAEDKERMWNGANVCAFLLSFEPLPPFLQDVFTKFRNHCQMFCSFQETLLRSEVRE